MRDFGRWAEEIIREIEGLAGFTKRSGNCNVGECLSERHRRGGVRPPKGEEEMAQRGDVSDGTGYRLRHQRNERPRGPHRSFTSVLKPQKLQPWHIC